MGPRALLLISVLPAWLLAGACKRSENEAVLVKYAADKVSITNDNGTLRRLAKPFTGTLYLLTTAGDSIFSRSYRNGLEYGVHQLWYPNGNLQEMRRYIDGKKEGISLGYWPDGRKRYRYQLMNDLYEGIQYEWYSNGQLYSKKNYLSGHEHGLQQSWNADGSIKSNYEARNGRNYGNIGKKNCYSVWKDGAIRAAR